MHPFLERFPTNDFSILLLIVLLPLFGAAVNGVFGKRLGKEAVTLLGVGTIFLSFILCLACFLALGEVQAGTELPVRFFWHGWEWVRVSLQSGAQLPIGVNLSLDALSAAMSLVVTGVGFLIHLYSTKYMEHDAGYARFFSYLNLFIFSMLVLILGDSLPILFIGWEGVGLCSYLLIGFWFQDGKNAAAGQKAFVVNRIGDFGLLVAMALLVYYTGALDWSGLEAGAGNLLQPQQIWPLGSHFPMWERLGSAGVLLNTHWEVTAATLVGLFLFLGCAGKSAQIPLYVWLPDAMAGPTPVSALIHAATMVTAGVYLVCRMSMVFVLSPAAMFTVAGVGALTALLAATIALVQNDIKKVLAYSTVSQLGYMFLGVGVGAFTAGFFHVVTHAFFKACLFLGAGSVIHAMHARIHDTDASQDMRNMGGLWRYMPYTFWTFTAAWAAIVGFPFTSGFFSKDEILLKSYTSFIPSAQLRGFEMFTWPDWAGKALYAIGLLTAVLTAFYMTRLLIGIFFGRFRGWKIVDGWKPPREKKGHHESHGAGRLKGPIPHESPWPMWVPLVILGGLALVAGLWNAHLLHLHAFEDWLEPAFAAAASKVSAIEGAEAMEQPFLGLAFLAFALGVGVAYWMYLQKRGEPARRLAEAAPGLHRVVLNKWWVDEAYDEVVVGSVDQLAEICVTGDKWVVDGILARLTAFLTAAAGSILRYFQNGRVQAYAAVMVVGLGWLGWFFLFPRAEARTVSDHAAGAYSVSAAPGLGYSYRWDEDGDGKLESSETFSDRTEISFKLDVGQKKTVPFQVKNAFGRTATAEVTVERPRPDLSGAPATPLEPDAPEPGEVHP